MKDLTEIASISGKGGLYKVIKPGRAGVILESMDEKKIKLATNPTHKVSILAEISIYTNNEEGSLPLEDILKKIHKEFNDDPGVDSKSSPSELMSFIEYIIPEYDKNRVYPSDVKKLVSWYGILLREEHEFFKEEKEKVAKGKKEVKEKQANDQDKDSPEKKSKVTAVKDKAKNKK